VILDVLKKIGEGTADEIAGHCDLDRQQIAPRLAGMLDDGLIQLTGAKRMTPRGRPSRCFEISGGEEPPEIGAMATATAGGVWNGKVHEAASRFPMIEGEEWRGFVEDIKKWGLQQPIALLPDGTLLDGRNRIKACKEIGAEPHFVTVDPESPMAYVISANYQRRQLTAGQRAAFAAEEVERLAPAAEARKADGQRAGGKARHGSLPQKVAASRSEAETTARAAKLFGTNKEYVKRAKAIKKESPDLFEKLKDGTIEIGAAIAENAKRTGKRDAVWANARKRKAQDWIGRVSGVVDYCEKVSVESICEDAQLRKCWLKTITEARTALTRLEKKIRRFP
jgi:ParB-like chromosome segregation protein Spo0J